MVLYILKLTLVKIKFLAAMTTFLKNETFDLPPEACEQIFSRQQSQKE